MTVRSLVVAWITLSSLKGLNSQYAQQSYRPVWRHVGQEWTYAFGPESGYHPRILVTRLVDSYMYQRQSSDPHKANTGFSPAPNTGFPAEPDAGFPAEPDTGSSAGPKKYKVETTQTNGDSAVQSSSATQKVAKFQESDHSAEADRGSGGERQKREYSSWGIFNNLSPDRFLVDRSERYSRLRHHDRHTRDTKEGRESRAAAKPRTRDAMWIGADRNAYNVYSRAFPMRTKRETPEERHEEEIHNPEPKVTSWSTSGAGVEGRR